MNGAAFAVSLFLWIPLACESTERLPDSAPGQSLPPAVKLSDVEIRLARGGSGGCAGRCIEYNVLVKGDGVVEYEDLGSAPRQRSRRRHVPVEEVVSLVDAFVRARFFEAATSYTGSRVAVRDGDSIRFYTRGGADGPTWDITLRLGTQTKIVHLYEAFPEELGRLRDRIDKMGGPGAWPAR